MKTFFNLQLINKILIVAGLMGVCTLANATEMKGRVISVVDGNTLEIAAEDNQTYTISLSGIDSPELDQAYGSDAKQFMEKLLLNKCVTVRLHGKDRAGNYMAVIIANKNLDARVALLEEGLAWTSEKNPLPELETIKVTARQKGKGLWSEKDPTPPWVFRRQQLMLAPKSS